MPPVDRIAESPFNLQATLISLPAAQWLTRRPEARVLHVFNSSVNVLAEDGEILSLATTEIEPGPFSIVAEYQADRGDTSTRYFHGVEVASRVVANASGLEIGRLRVQVKNAERWDPRLSAGLLNQQSVGGGLYLLRDLTVHGASKESLLSALRAQDGSRFQRRIGEAWHELCQGILSDDPRLCAEGARQAAGVGNGLTPAGDDFLVGVLVGLWTGLTDPGRLAKSIVAGATPYTSRLSAAWITAAGRGEVGQVWHDLASALLDHDQGSILSVGRRVLSTGHTSGSDAMSGFVATLDLFSGGWDQAS